MELSDFMEINPTTIVITLVAYGFCMFVLWNNFIGNWVMRDRIIITIAALPVLYLIVNFQMNR